MSLNLFSYFDTGKHSSGAEPKRFYHGFVLGLLVDLNDRYVLTSNRESGFGRYDVMLEPKEGKEVLIGEQEEHFVTSSTAEGKYHYEKKAAI